MVPVFLITALLAACGGGGGSSDSDPASPEPSNRAPRAALEGPARLTAGTEGTFRLTLGSLPHQFGQIDVERHM